MKNNLSAIIFLILVFASCGRLNQKSANEIFLSENPTYTIVYSAPGEGWDGVVYYHFEYKKPNDETVYKKIWCLEEQKDGTWKVTNRDASNQ
jgi:hypothetical protein